MRRRKKITSINYTTSETNTKKSKIWIHFLFVIVLGIIGVMYWSYSSQEEPLEYIELGEPTLPRIVSIESNYAVNELLPYVQEMDILTMRDAISPLTPQGNLVLEIQDYGAEISQFTYTVYSLDGSKVLKEEILTQWDDNVITLNLSNVVTTVEESLMEIVLTLADGTKTYYYTRVMTYNSCYLEQNLSFIEQMHEDIFEKNTEALTQYFSEEITSSSYQELTQDSGLEQIMWGELSPTIVGEVKWTITECTSLFMNVLLEYQIQISSETDSGEIEYYNVVESYRVGYSTSNNEVGLKQYNRTMNQIFQGGEGTFTDSGILLGIVDRDDISYMANDEETMITFVQERGLYAYYSETNECVAIFSLEEINAEDGRYVNDDYNIKILSIDENGSVNFLVFGYMNRGTNEGKVGVTIYAYEASTGNVVEKAFIASTQSYAVGQDEMSQGMYYNSENELLYIIAQGCFYQVNLIDYTQIILAENVDATTYKISEDGTIIAYLSDESDGTQKCTVLDFESGETYDIAVGDNAKILPLGFLEQDFIFGVYNDDATLEDEGGVEITPMYKIEIRNSEGKVEIVYENENQYIRDISVIDNMVTMNLLEIQDEQYVYAGQDVITNNEVKVTETISLTTSSSEKYLRQVVLTIDIEENSLEEGVAVLGAQLVLNPDTISISYDMEIDEETYYAYAYGKLQVISTMASDAIQYASANMGAVINDRQEYVWRSGNRDLTYTVSNYSTIAARMENGETAIEIVSAWANQNPVSYTGCTTEQMCYIINQGQVIAAKLEDETWIMLIGYTGSTMYYLNESGTKQSMYMSTLDGKVIELIGDGIY